MEFRYSDEKNVKLKLERKIGFKELVDAIIKGNMLAAEAHPNQGEYPGQRLIYVELYEEVYVVPCVEESDGTYFMKTLYPSRKARKKFPKPKKKKKKNANNDN